MFDEHDAVAGSDEAVQDVDELFDVGHVEADSRFVEHVERVLLLAASAGSCGGIILRLASRLLQFGDELGALRLW